MCDCGAPWFFRPGGCTPYLSPLCVYVSSHEGHTGKAVPQTPSILSDRLRDFGSIQGRLGSQQKLFSKAQRKRQNDSPAGVENFFDGGGVEALAFELN